MKNNLKYLATGLLLLASIIVIVMLMNRPSQDNDTQDPFADQLSNCQKIIPSYVALTEQDATDKADKENRTFRIIKRDSINYSVTADYSPSRLNFEVNNGLIAKASCG